jgi:hypothetical protein
MKVFLAAIPLKYSRIIEATLNSGPEVDGADEDGEGKALPRV